MFRNTYEMEKEMEARARSLRLEVEQERTARLARQGQPRGGFLRRVLFNLGEKLIVVGVELHRRYGECRTGHQALLEHILSLERAFTTERRGG